MPPLCISLSTYVAVKVPREVTTCSLEISFSRSSILRLSVITLLITASILSSSARAQSTFGSIRGIATDSSGAAIPGASVALHSVEENTDRTATTDADGSYLFNNVKPGQYVVTVACTGFSTTNISGVTLIARQDLRINATLSVAAEAVTVNVNAAADQINTESATLSDSKDNTLITQLPLNNRATTTSPLGALAISANVQQDSAGNIAIAGASSSQVNYSVDGISTANVRQNGALQDAYPSQEGIAAAKVTAFNNSAEFSQVGDVTFTTKSGGNQIHGSLFEYFQNDVLDADPYGFVGKAPKHFNTFGGSLSGPIAIPHVYDGHNKTFFFADYEGNRRSTATLQQFLVPSVADRTGNLADIGGPIIPTLPLTPPRKLSLRTTPCPMSRGNPATTTRTFSQRPPGPMAPISASIRPSDPSSLSTAASAART